MRDYTYINGARFIINNLYRSQRFDIDRLDLNWVGDEKPEFTRGAIVMILSYCAVLKNTKRDSYEKKQVAMNRHYQ